MSQFLINTLPVILVMIFTITLVIVFMKQETRRRQLEIRSKEGAELMRQRILAYERLTLLLERLHPEALVLREQKKNMTSIMFQQHLLKVIRSEFDHNLSMQIYVSDRTWAKIKSTREGLVRLVNSTAANTDPNAPAIVLGHSLIESSGGDLTHYFRNSIKAIKSEMNEFYGGK